MSNNIIRTSGQVRNIIKDHDYVVPKDKQGNPVPQAVAMVMACVAWHRLRALPIKTVYLKGAFYEQFKDWTRYRITEEEADLIEKGEINLTYDSVKVQKGSDLSERNLYVDFYKNGVIE